MRLTKYLQELTHLRAVIENGSISRAASRVGLSQPALTRSIRRLELHLGVRLVDRTARGVSPTPFGEALVNHIRLIDTELERAVSTIDVLKGGNAGTIRCGGTIGALASLLPTAVKELQRYRPNINVRVIEGIPAVLTAMLRLGELDVIVCAKADTASEPDLVCHVIGADQIDLFARRDHPMHRDVHNSLESLATGQSWILPSAAGDLYRSIEKDFERHKVVMPTRIVETSSFVMLNVMLKTTDQIAITTSETLSNELRDGTIKRLYGDWRFSQTAITIYHRGDIAPLPIVTSFIRSLQRAGRQRKQALYQPNDHPVPSPRRSLK